MPRFEIFSDGQPIGWSDLEHGDPPMGVAHGLFIPGPGYSGIQEQVRASTQRDQRHFKFTVRVDGVEVPASGVSIADYSVNSEADEMEVAVLGIEYPAYGDVFPEHVAAYKQRSA
ncbi:hypothetical protein JWR97_04780 [Pseudomonas cedrina subsp. fulgida]|nr:hypothetical protein [Pseudomonas cedrina subsp. fulgida]